MAAKNSRVRQSTAQDGQTARAEQQHGQGGDEGDVTEPQLHGDGRQRQNHAQHDQTCEQAHGPAGQARQRRIGDVHLRMR